MSYLPPYPAYKPTAIPWLQQVPEHWDWKRAKSLFRIVDVKSKTGREELLTVSSANGIVRRRESNVNMFKAKTYVGHKLCWPEDLVINSLWAWGRGLGFAREHGIISSAYGVYRLRPEQRYLWRYLDYTLRSSAYQWELQVRSKGVWKSRLQLSDASFLDMPILIPPKEDAELIVRYLHALDAKVKRYIRAKRKLIAALQEQKQAIIQQAVTRGLDPNVKLKPSGVEWLGEVPEHWERRPLKYLSHAIQNGSTPLTSERHFYEGGRIPWFGPSSISTGTLGAPVRHLTPSAFEKGKARLIQPPALLLVVIGASAGKMALLLQDAATNQQITSYELREDIVHPRFVLLQLQAALNWLKSTTSTATIPIVDSGIANRLTIMFPSLTAQAEIIESISKETRSLDAALQRAEQGINRLQEYHTRLIADVVTGAVDVRAAAQALPGDQMIGGSEDQMMEEEPLSMAAEGEAEYGEEPEL